MIINWFSLSIISTIAIGIVAFINKIFSQKNISPKSVTILLYGHLVTISLLYILIQEPVLDLSLTQIIICVLWGIQVYSYSLIMILALRYLPTSTYFIGVRLSSSFSLLFIGLLFFEDHLNNYEITGFLLGVLAMILLFEKSKNQKQTNYKKGGALLILGSASLVAGHSLTKIFSNNLEQVPFILFITFISALFFSFLFGFSQLKKERKNLKILFSLNLIQALLIYFYFTSMFYIYSQGDLGTSYKIQSYSPFIPIILSTLFFHEKITHKQAFAIIITALSLWFFA